MKRIRKWFWLPVGLTALVAIAFTFFALTRKAHHPYQFLRQAKSLGSNQQISNVHGSPAFYVVKSSYRIKSAPPSIISRVDKELSAQGWVLSAAIGSSVRWTTKGSMIYLEHRGPIHDTEISIQTVVPATPLHRFQVWLSSLNNKEESLSLRT